MCVCFFKICCKKHEIRIYQFWKSCSKNPEIIFIRFSAFIFKWIPEIIISKKLLESLNFAFRGTKFKFHCIKKPCHIDFRLRVSRNMLFQSMLIITALQETVVLRRCRYKYLLVFRKLMSYYSAQLKVPILSIAFILLKGSSYWIVHLIFKGPQDIKLTGPR